MRRLRRNNHPLRGPKCHSVLALASPPVFWIGPNTAFVLAIFGALGIYCEFVWPGRIYPLLLGSSALIGGCYSLWRLSPSDISLALIAAAVLLYAAEVFWNTRFISVACATGCLAAGFCEMFQRPPWIVPGLAVPVSLAFGAATGVLCYSARRSRQMKWSDIKGTDG